MKSKLRSNGNSWILPGSSLPFVSTRIAARLRGALLLLGGLMLAIGNVKGEPETKRSSAMERFEVDDSQNEFYTLFRYTPVEGLAYEEGVGRRDPSNIIKVGEFYYVWYTRISGSKPTQKWRDAPETSRAYRWDLAEIWYAKSQDGFVWEEKGLAVGRGVRGAFDDRSVFTCNILIAEGRYYLCYQAQCFPFPESDQPNVIGMARADSPDGPWEKLSEPILRPSPPHPERKAGEKWHDGPLGAWDSWKVHDPGITVYKGKYWLYYKGQQSGRWPFDSKLGVAIADKPEGPYIKHPLNPLTNSGHEVWAWPYREGIALMCDWAGPEKNTIQYASDGLNFEVVASVEDIPPAGGSYIEDKFWDTGDGKGFTWGLAYVRDDWDWLVRYDCDLHREKAKTALVPYRYRHYGQVRAVLDDPAKFKDSRRRKKAIEGAKQSFQVENKQ
ncbi:glycoside hydrolase family 117 protein [Pelagicoccus mobilis]|uniref:Glycosyl hydrolase n=1 Tax=Pelagicoccus mobilis TaxID=415221 RepID=A0A934RWG7_9BACT|nr:glycosyl hydrolase [Pelagicoccus mobilis]MBK1876046.1 glycosyl hydrolase [Pelagicoccus mobilis]